MNPALVAHLLNISTSTLHRWTDLYAEFLLPDATPAKGQARVLSDHDVRVMRWVCEQRAAGRTQEAILQTLREAARHGWRDLPPLPPEWAAVERNVTVPARYVERLKEQLAASQKVIEQQRQLLQITTAALQVSEAQQKRNEHRALPFGNRRFWVLLTAMIIIGCGIAWVVLWS